MKSLPDEVGMNGDFCALHNLIVNETGDFRRFHTADGNCVGTVDRFGGFAAGMAFFINTIHGEGRDIELPPSQWDRLWAWCPSEVNNHAIIINGWTIRRRLV